MKKKGSALILAILMLSFFTAVALTILTVAKNRNERSISTIVGNEIDKSLDIGIVLAQYDLYLATEYVTKGYLYETRNGILDYRADNHKYSTPETSQSYSLEIKLGLINIVVPMVGKHYTGIVLNNYSDYFVSVWDPSEGIEIIVDGTSIISDSNILRQPWLESEVVSGNKVISRKWENNSGEQIKRLWEYSKDEKLSVGGYRLIDISGKDKVGRDLTLPLSHLDLDRNNNTLISLTYEKIVSINNENINIGNFDYKITYDEEVEVSVEGTEIIVENSSGSITVEKLD